jgi:hypothetical protein
MSETDKTISFVLEHITPDMAQAFLSRSERAQQKDPTKRQRTTKAGPVIALRAEIDADNFHATHQAIAIDPDGWVFDGRHRLTAISQGSKGAWLYVARYSSEEHAKSCMRFLDIGSKRSLGNTLEACGKIDVFGEDVVAAIRAIWMLTTPSTSKPLSAASMDMMLEKYAEEILHLRAIAPKARATVIGAFAYVREIGFDVDGLLSRIYTGIGLSDAEAKLRTLITEFMRGGGAGERREFMAKVLRLIERIHTGDKIAKTMPVDVQSLLARWEAKRALTP